MSKHKHLSRLNPVKRRRELDMASAARRKKRQEYPDVVRAADRDIYKRNKHKWKNIALKKHYGITLAEWNAMFTGQGYCCAGCGTQIPGGKYKAWQTDHNHKTGVVRGILCAGCNVALGMVADDPNRLRMLAKYLEDRG